MSHFKSSHSRLFRPNKMKQYFFILVSKFITITAASSVILYTDKCSSNLIDHKTLISAACKKSWILKNIDFEIVDTSNDGKVCGDDQKMIHRIVTDFYSRNRPKAIIGPDTSFQLLALIPFAQEEQVPIISYETESTAEPLPSISGFYRVNSSIKSKIHGKLILMATLLFLFLPPKLTSCCPFD